MIHQSVLKEEVIKVLDPKPGEFFIDGTLGGGGHAKAILERVGKDGKLLAIDFDSAAVRHFEGHLSELPGKIFPVVGNFADVKKILEERGLGKADGIVLDLGLSSDELASSGRGFSFQNNEPLLMTLSDSFPPLKELLKSLSESEIAGVLRDYSDERYAGRIAAKIKEILRTRPIETTFDLRDAILKATPKSYERGRIHPATRSFQAFRVLANREYENLATVISALPTILNSGGRAAIITFHSGEDRLVKRMFKDMDKRGVLKIINKKVIVPSREEILGNTRSRSAKLRAILIPKESVGNAAEPARESGTRSYLNVLI